MIIPTRLSSRVFGGHAVLLHQACAAGWRSVIAAPALLLVAPGEHKKSWQMAYKHKFQYYSCICISIWIHAIDTPTLFLPSSRCRAHFFSRAADQLHLNPAGDQQADRNAGKQLSADSLIGIGRHLGDASEAAARSAACGAIMQQP